MNWFKRNINGILGTIIFHLIIIIIAMIFEFRSHYQHIESYTYISTEFLEEFEDKRLKNNEKLDDINIEDFISEIRNIGIRQQQITTTTKNIENMSLDEIRKLYEEQILREKYGEDYEKITQTTYKDLIEESLHNQKDFSNERISETTYSGPALVFVELDNEERKSIYVHVPVYKCISGGVVVVDITLNPDGRVARTNIKSVKGTGNTSCIENEARNAALKSRFETVKSGLIENGRITYHFIQQ